MGLFKHDPPKTIQDVAVLHTSIRFVSPDGTLIARYVGREWTLGKQNNYYRVVEVVPLNLEVEVEADPFRYSDTYRHGVYDTVVRELKARLPDDWDKHKFGMDFTDFMVYRALDKGYLCSATEYSDSDYEDIDNYYMQWEPVSAVNITVGPAEHLADQELSEAEEL